MSSPDPSHDSFASDPYDQWDPYEDPDDRPSQRQTQTNELKLCQPPDWDRELYTLLYCMEGYGQ